jgi:hypothetical protein
VNHPVNDFGLLIVNLAPGIIILAIFLGIYGLRHSKRSRALQILAGRFGGKIRKFSLFATWEGVWAGRNFRLRLIPEGKNTPAYLEVYVFKKGTYRLKIQKETWAHRAGKRLGWLREMPVHDPAFDKEFFMSSNKPMRAAEFLGRLDVKSAVLSLFAEGFDIVAMDEKKIFIRKPQFTVEHDLAPHVVEQTLHRLETLAMQE